MNITCGFEYIEIVATYLNQLTENTVNIFFIKKIINIFHVYFNSCRKLA